MQLGPTSPGPFLDAPGWHACSLALIVEPDPLVLEQRVRLLLRARKAVMRSQHLEPSTSGNPVRN